MSEPARFETTHGNRAPTSVGERLVVGLGALALLGGLLIAVGNVVDLDRVIGSASPTPAVTADPTPRPSRTPRPSPTPRPPQVVTLDDDTPLGDAPDEPDYFFGWVRAREEVVIRSLPAPDGSELARLAPGEVLQAERTDGPDEDGWLMVWMDGTPGYVPTMVDDRQAVDVFVDTQPYGGGVWRVAAGDNGFLATGIPPQVDTTYPGTILGASDGGGSWEEVSSDPRRGEISGAAWGPAGWLMATLRHDSGNPRPLIWQSDDGRAWTYLGSLPQIGDAWPADLLATESGYLLPTQAGWGTATVGWFSADGVTWHESILPARQSAETWTQVVASPLGFYAWEITFPPTPVPEEYEGVPGAAYFSTSGTTWRQVPDGPRGPVVQMATTPDGVLAVEPDPDTGAPHVWRGDLADGALRLHRSEADEQALAGVLVTSLVSHADGPMAFGVDLRTRRPVSYTYDGLAWQRAGLPAEFTGNPRLAASGDAGVVVVGSRPSLYGSNPLLWILQPDGSWLTERDPLIRHLPDPTSAACPEPPRDPIDFIVLDPALGVVCFGGEDLTVRAWSSSCDECWGGPEEYSPAWLAQPTDNQLFLSPIENHDGNWSRTAILAPSVDVDRSREQAWLEITGHYDDPASQTCRWEPESVVAIYHDGPESLVNDCRRQFVVTSVRVVEGPAG
jgi:hypothetical protein